MNEAKDYAETLGPVPLTDKQKYVSSLFKKGLSVAGFDNPNRIWSEDPNYDSELGFSATGDFIIDREMQMPLSANNVKNLFYKEKDSVSEGHIRVVFDAGDEIVISNRGKESYWKGFLTYGRTIREYRGKTAIYNRCAEYNRYERDNPSEFIINDEGTLLLYKGNDEDVVVPEGIKLIGRKAFMYHEELKSIKLPSSLRSIGIKAFYECNSLSRVDITSSSLEKIGNGAFFGCTALETIVLPKTELIFGGAFQASGLKDINVDVVTEIQRDCFDGTPFQDTFIDSKWERIKACEDDDGFAPGSIYAT